MDFADNQSLNVTNVSLVTSIYVRFCSPKNANIPLPPQNSISPGTSERFAVKNGTMNMFVWTYVDAPPVWKGIIPTKVKKPVIIFPEQNKVLYDGVQIPEGFGPNTDLSGQGSSRNFLRSMSWWTYFIVAFLIVLILFGVLWYLGKLPLMQFPAKTKINRSSGNSQSQGIKLFSNRFV